MSNYKILIVEDESIEAMQIESSLQSMGYDVVAISSSGKDALEKIANLKPDLIIMDIILKGKMDGVEVATQIKEDFDIPVIYLTGHPEESTIQRAKHTEPYGYIIKPFNITELKNAIELALYKHEMDKTVRSSGEMFLQESEDKLRLKLDKILSNDYVVEGEEFQNIINTEEIQSLMNDFYTLTNMGIAILDLEGNILVATGWQDICTKFHRVNEESCKNCLESDLILTKDLKPGEYRIYQCKNNMWDMVTPIILGEKHIGNLFLGQFFFEDETPDYDLFVAQAEKFGFDKQKYLAALEKVPKWSRNRVETVMDFYSRFAQIISGLSFSNLKLAKSLSDSKIVEVALQKSEEHFRAVAESAVDAIITTNAKGKVLFSNNSLETIFGYSKEEIIGKQLTILMPDRFKENYLNQLKRFKSDGYHKLVGKVVSSTGLRKEGDEFPFEMSLSTWKSGEKTYFTSIIRDITERRKNEEALKDSEEKFRVIFNNATDMISLINLSEDGKHPRYLEVNETGIKRLGYSKEELLNMSPSDIDEEPETPKHIEKLLKNGHVQFETIHVAKNGSKIPVEVIIHLIDYKGRKIYIEISRDITERKTTENALMESERNYRELVDNSLVGVYKTNIKGDILFSNNAMVEILKSGSMEDLKAKNITDLYSNPAERDKFIEELKKENSLKQYELEMVSSTGETINVIISAKLTDDTISGMIMDITKIKMAEDALRSSEQKYRTLFESNPDYTILAELDGTTLDVNAAAADVTGLPKDEFVGKHLTELKIFPEADLRMHGDMFSRLFKGEYVAPYESRIYDKKGKIRWVETIPTIIKNENKQDYILIINSNINERKKAEDEIKASLKEKEILLKEIHHRVKNNLQIISSLLDLQEAYVDEEESVNVLKESRNRVLSMAMIHEMIYQSDDLSHINFSDYIRNLTSNLFYSFGAKNNITSVINVEQIYLNIDTSVPLGLIISELMSNSLKYAFPEPGKKGEISISLKSLKNELELIISDNGIGFPDDIDFRNTESSLGLKLVNSLVNQLDGTIELDTSQGTRFTIKFKELKYKERI